MIESNVEADGRGIRMPPPSHRGRWDPVRWNARAALATRRQDQILAAAVCHHCLRLAGHGDRAALFRRTDAFHGASVLLHGQPRSLDCHVQPYIRATCNPDSDSPIGRSASRSAATGMAATGCSIWCAGGRTRATSKNCAQHRLAGLRTGPHRVWPRPGAGR